MKLQEKMDAFKKSFIDQAPVQILGVMERSGKELLDSGIADRAVKVGDKAPDFSLHNTLKTEVSLGVLLANGPVVLSFFRGRW